MHMKPMLCLIALLGGCAEPVAGDGVVIHNYTTTFEGSSITFNCEDGLFPNDSITATCSGGYWNTDPATYTCTDTTTGSTTTINNTDVINCLATCSTIISATYQNSEKGIQAKSKINLYALSGSIYYH